MARQYGEVVFRRLADGTRFCRHGTNFIEHYVCRGTSWIGAMNLSPVTKLVAGIGEVSRYKFDRSRLLIPGYKVGGGHWRDRGIIHCKSVKGAVAKVEEPRYAG